MNQIIHTKIHYLRASRTIERLVIQSGENLYDCFIYNYEGYHFRFFENKVALKSFLNSGVEPRNSFESETALDDFLEGYLFNSEKN